MKQIFWPRIVFGKVNQCTTNSHSYTVCYSLFDLMRIDHLYFSTNVPFEFHPKTTLWLEYYQNVCDKKQITKMMSNTLYILFMFCQHFVVSLVFCHYLWIVCSGAYQKMLQVKVAKNLISYKKLSGSISLSTPGVELGIQRFTAFEIL